MRDESRLSCQSHFEIFVAEKQGQAKAYERNQDPPIGQASKRSPVHTFLRGQRLRVHPTGIMPQPKHERAFEAKEETARVGSQMLHPLNYQCFEISPLAQDHPSGLEARKLVLERSDGNQIRRFWSGYQT